MEPAVAMLEAGAMTLEAVVMTVLMDDSRMVKFLSFAQPLRCGDKEQQAYCILA